MPTTTGESSKDTARQMLPKRVPLKQLLACVSGELSRRCQQPCFRLTAVHPGGSGGDAPTWDVEATAPVREEPIQIGTFSEGWKRVGTIFASFSSPPQSQAPLTLQKSSTATLRARTRSTNVSTMHDDDSTQ
jgi:hypothetical protein